MKKILIMAMKTWGELGNYLAAETLAMALTSIDKTLQINVVPAESIVPEFGIIGEKIKEIVTPESSPDRVEQLYRDMFGKYEQSIYPMGFEVSKERTDELKIQIDSVRAIIEEYSPDVVIGTKGIIARLCYAAIADSSCKPKVINYITNHGLIDLSMHRSNYVEKNIVFFDFAKQLLVSRYGYDENKVFVSGRVMSVKLYSQLEAFKKIKVTSDGGEKVCMIIFSNRISKAVYTLLENLSDQANQADLFVICQGDEVLKSKMQQLMDERGITNWKVYDNLNQASYFDLINSLRQTKYPLLISKTGPNTMLEACQFNIPVFLLNSGLPMEQWVKDFVRENNIGCVEDNIKHLYMKLADILNDPAKVNMYRESMNVITSQFKDQQTVLKRLKEIILS